MRLESRLPLRIFAEARVGRLRFDELYSRQTSQLTP